MCVYTNRIKVQTWTFLLLTCIVCHCTFFPFSTYIQVSLYLAISSYTITSSGEGRERRRRRRHRKGVSSLFFLLLILRRRGWKYCWLFGKEGGGKGGGSLYTRERGQQVPLSSFSRPNKREVVLYTETRHGRSFPHVIACSAVSEHEFE